MTTIDPKPTVVQSLSADEWLRYADRNALRGWHPIPTGRLDEDESPPKYKKPWLAGITGRTDFATPDQYPDWPRQVRWMMESKSIRGVLSLGLRCPPNRIGIDVDNYDNKPGLDSLRDLEATLGPLPPAPVVSARDLSTGSGIRLFRIHDGWRGRTNPAAGIELIQWWHRHIQAPPSWHYNGQQYRAYKKTGVLIRSGLLPGDDGCPMLPDAWHDGLADADSQGGCGDSATSEDIAAFASQYVSGPQPDALDGLIKTKFGDSPDDTHTPMLILLSKAAQEAKGHRYPWSAARDKIRRAAERSYRKRGKRLTEQDWNGSVGWAIASVRSLSEDECYQRWQSGEFSQAVSDFENSPWANGHAVEDIRTEPTDAEIQFATHRRLIARGADIAVKAIEAKALLSAAEDKAFDGLAFLESRQAGEPIWGSGSKVPWAQNQGLMLFGSDGTGKSSLIQQIVLARAGLRDPNVLGMPVTSDERVTVYLALDRPAQIQDSILRMVDLNDPLARDLLKRRLVFWQGAVPFQCDHDPKLFAQWAMSLGGDNVGLVVVDSVKDMISNPSDNDAGIAFNDTMQHMIAAGVEFGCCHHNRKAQAQNTKPRNLSDVYGSRFLYAGMGSVLNIWADDVADSLRELTQLKAPFGKTIGRTEYRDESRSGTSTSEKDWRSVIVSNMAIAGSEGLTDAELAMAAFESLPSDSGFPANRQKITRYLKGCARTGSPYERIELERGSVWRIQSDDYPEPRPRALTSAAKAQKRAAERQLASIDARITELDRETE